MWLDKETVPFGWIKRQYLVFGLRDSVTWLDKEKYLLSG